MAQNTNQHVNLIIRKRDRVLFEGEVLAFSSHNAKGVFDILAEHENFISIINDKYVIHKLDGTTSEAQIDDGIVNVYGNKVSVYLGIGR